MSIDSWLCLMHYEHTYAICVVPADSKRLNAEEDKKRHKLEPGCA